MSVSDSDAEFFDAAEELGSPRSPILSKFDLAVRVQAVDEPSTAESEKFQGSCPKDDEDPEIQNILSSAVEQMDQKDEENVAGKLLEEAIVSGKCEVVLDDVSPETENHPEIVASPPAEKGESVEQSAVPQPDLTCAQERPTNLPGVKPVRVISDSPEHKVKPTASGDGVKPRNAPPPRPPAPKRPPPPKKYVNAPPYTNRSYLNETDDGLLTPNSTVDNLTREFAEALNKADSENKTSKPHNENLHHGKKTTGEREQKDLETSRHSKTSALLPQSSHSLGRKDEEIISNVIVKNLDTGESMPLSVAAEQACLNPLALQIMSRTKEFTYAGSNSSSTNESLSGTASALVKSGCIDSDSLSVASDDIEIGKDVSSSKAGDSKQKIKKKSKKFRKLVGKGMSKVKVAAEIKMEKAVLKAKHLKEEVMHEEALNVSSDEDSNDLSSASAIKVKAASSNKGPYQFSHLKLAQDITVHVGAVWCMKFSQCGRLLATAGQDNVIWVWVLKDFYNYFSDMRNKYKGKDEDSLNAHRQNMQSTMQFSQSNEDVFNYAMQTMDDEEDNVPFRQVPFSSYVGHSADVLDLAWSKNFFILSSSMDKTVRLWHLSRKECLTCFQHIDFVTAIAFHPKDDRYFLSGSLDSKLRLWNIPDKKVALWNEVAPDGSTSASSGGGNGGALITTVNFCENGKFAVCGTYDGRCIFFDTEHLKYHTQIHVRSSRGRNNKGHKITGIEPLQGEHKILVTSNDSRIRLYDLRDLSLTCKYKGHTNLSSQIKASFSPDSKYIITGSEDKSVYIWKTNLPQDVMKMSSFRRDRNDSWESIKVHDAVVTCAVFAPFPHLIYKANGQNENKGDKQSSKSSRSILSLSSKKQSSEELNVIISADFNGGIKIIVGAE